MSFSGVSVIIPAYREQENIENAIDNVVAVAAQVGIDYEIIVINDGSPDQTGEFAQLKAQQNTNIRVATNAVNQGFGYSFRRGVKMASKEYVSVFPGDNDMSSQSLKDLIAARSGADIVITYAKANSRRSLFRRVVSKFFVLIMNILFGLRLEYYNGAFICKTELLRSIPIKSTGLAALAECIVRLLKTGHSWRAIYFEHAGRRHEKSKAFNWKSLKAVAYTVMILFWDIHFANRFTKRV